METEQMARKLAALRERLLRDTGRCERVRLQEDLREIGRRCASLPDHDRRRPEEILGFDEHGLPG
jgi:antitoxin VapB